MAMENPNIIKVDACGVSVKVDKSAFEDVRYVMAMGAVSDESKSESEKLIWYTRALDVLFGGKAYGIMNQLAIANGGKLDEPTWEKFFKAVMESASKN